MRASRFARTSTSLRTVIDDTPSSFSNSLYVQEPLAWSSSRMRRWRESTLRGAVPPMMCFLGAKANVY